MKDANEREEEEKEREVWDGKEEVKWKLFLLRDSSME